MEVSHVLKPNPEEMSTYSSPPAHAPPFTATPEFLHSLLTPILMPCELGLPSPAPLGVQGCHENQQHSTPGSLHHVLPKNIMSRNARLPGCPFGPLVLLTPEPWPISPVLLPTHAFSQQQLHTTLTFIVLFPGSWCLIPVGPVCPCILHLSFNHCHGDMVRPLMAVPFPSMDIVIVP